MALDDYILRKVTRADGSTYESWVSAKAALSSVVYSLSNQTDWIGVTSATSDETTGRQKIEFTAHSGDSTGWKWLYEFTDDDIIGLSTPEGE